MAVLMTSEMPGTTRDDYDHLAHALVPTLQASPGFIAHVAGPVDGGYVVNELWESEEAHAAWFAEHVRPTMPAGAAEPSITYRTVTSIVTGPRTTS